MSIVVESSLLNTVESYISNAVESIYQSLEKGNKILIEEFIEKCNKWFTQELWEDIIDQNEIGCEILEKYKSKFGSQCWDIISTCDYLTDEFVRTNIDYFTENYDRIENLSENASQMLSEDLITEIGHLFNDDCWINIINRSDSDLFSNEFLAKNSYHFPSECWYYICRSYDLSKKFICEHIEQIAEDKDCLQIIRERYGYAKNIDN